MDKQSRTYQAYVQILKEELIPAMGCTEPIAIAYAAAKARDVLGGMPDKVEIGVSSNIIKNVKSDRQTEMAQWQAELQLGLRSKAEYRQHFYGEDEATAQNAIAAIQQESVATDILQGVLTNGNKNDNQNADDGKKGKPGRGKAQ